MLAKPGSRTKTSSRAAIGAAQGFGKNLQLFTDSGKFGQILNAIRRVPQAQCDVRYGEIVAQMEVEQVDDCLKGFRRNQANGQAMHFFADRIIFFAKGNQFS